MWPEALSGCVGLLVGAVIGIGFTWRYLYDAIKPEVEDDVTGEFKFPP